MSKFLDKTGLDTFWAKIKSTFQTLGNLVTAWGGTPSDTKYPSEKLVKTSLDAKAPNAVTTEAAIATGDKLLFSDASDSSKTKRMSTGFDTGVTDTFLCRNGSFNTVKESDVRWGGLFRQELSPIEFGNMCRNVIHNPPPAAIKFEKTTDGGTTWTEQTVTDNSKMQLCNLTLGSGFSIANSEYAGISSPNMLKARITLTAMSNFAVTSYSNTWFYAQCKRIVVYCSRSGDSRMKIELQSGPNFIAHNDTWIDQGTYTIAGDGGWNSIPLDQFIGGYYDQLSNRYVAIRFTYWIESGSTPRISISRIGIIPQIHWMTRAGNIPFLGVPISIENNGDGGIAKASRLATARKTYVTLGTASTTTTRDWSGDTTIPVDGTLGVGNGGTGKSSVTAGNYLVGNGTSALTEKTPNVAANDLINALTSGEATPTGDDYYVAQFAGGGTTTKTYHRRPVKALWEYIKSQISSVLGLTETSYGGNAATATALASGSTDRTKLDGIAAGAEVNVQSDWNQSTTTADDYIKNKPTLGTAAAKNVPTSGNASTSQVVMGNDTRLTDSRTPTSHASSATTYGVGTTSNYGHVKLATGDMNGATHADGVAVSKNHTHSQYLTSHQSIAGKLDKDASNAITGSGTGTAPTLLEGLGSGTSKISSGDVYIPTTNAAGATDGKWFKRKLANIAYGITGYGLGNIQVTNEDYSAGVGMSYGDFYNSSTPIYGWKIGTTSVNVSSGWATCNLRAIVVITDWTGTDGYSSTDFIGTLTITERMSAATLSTDSWKFIGKLTSLQPQRTNSSNRGWAVYCKGNSSTYSHEWYIGRRGSTASQMNGVINYSKITILPLFENNWTRAMERVNSAMTFNSSNYDDWWAQYVNIALPTETYSVGSASLPVYIGSDKEIKPMERSIILYDNRPNQTYKDPFFSARIDDNTFCNIEAWNKNGTIMCGLYARNGSGTTASFISYMDSDGYLHFGEDQANSWSGRSCNGSKHYFNGAEICGNSYRNSGTSHYRFYFGKITPGTDNGAKNFCGLLEVNNIATTSGAVRGTGFVAIIKIDSRNYDEFSVNMSIINNNGWNLTGLRPTLIVKEEGDERLFAIGFTNASGTLQAFQYMRFNLTQIGYSLGFTYDRWFSTASSKVSGEYFWPAKLGDAENAENAVSASELRIPYGSGSVYLQIGVSGSGDYLELGTNMANGVMVSYAGEASQAAVAGRLGTTSVGSANNPIYLNNGVPTECNWWVS